MKSQEKSFFKEKRATARRGSGLSTR